MSEKSKRTIGEMGYDTRLLVDRFSKVETGGIVTYDELSGTIGKDARESGVLYSALRIARRDYGIVFETVRKEGFKRLSDVEILNSLISILPLRMRSLTKRESKKIACVNNESLDNGMRIKRDMSLALIGAVEVFTGTKNLKKLETMIAGESKLPPMKEIMLSLCAGN